MLEGSGAVLMDRLETIARQSESGAGVTRLPFTDEHRRANLTIAGWMDQAGLDVRTDAAGTLIGRRPGPPGAPTFLMGSHQDSIRHGGRYDGILGVALPILVLERLKDAAMPFAVDVLAFADEEGVRFPTALMGPRALAGTFDPACLALQDKDGVCLADALDGFGGRAGDVTALRRDPAETLGYLEVHIEQGPVLESEGLPLGIVSGICGIERWGVTLTGQAGHAGTVPMDLRRDALTGLAEIALAVERLCRETDDLVGVVGKIAVEPNVVNGIPGFADFSIELRSPDDEIRAQAAGTLTGIIETLCNERGLTNTVIRPYAQGGVACDEGLSALLAESVQLVTGAQRRLMSGATHDASAMADLCRIAMLFVRCEGGLSHHPDEAVTAADLESACRAVAGFLLSLAGQSR